MSKVETIDYQGKDYATVPARLKEFRQSNPRASISTEPMAQTDGSMIIRALIVTDRADESSAQSTGSARYSEKEMIAKKAYEKLETIAVGRALSLLGYLNNGDIASSEEMLEFEGFKAEKYETEIAEAKDVKSLIGIFNRMNQIEKKQFTDMLSERKKELANEADSK